MENVDKNPDKHDLILSAARSLIGEYGFSALTMDKVAAKAGIAKGTIYLYFKDKNELIESALKRGFERLFERIEKRVEKEASSLEKLGALIHENLTYINENRFFFKSIFLDEINIVFLKKKSVESFNLRRKKYASFVSEIIKRGINSGEFRKDINPDRMGYLLIALIKTDAIYNFMNKNQDLSPEMIKSESSDMLDFFVKGISAQYKHDVRI